MSELRTKLITLAIQGGATIENATKVAGDWEQWALFGGWHTDPLRLGVPPPELTTEEREALSKPSPETSCNGNCGASYCDENGCLDKKESTGTSVPMKIDWSRPQLVVCNPEGLVVETTGATGHDHRGETFEGYLYSLKSNGRISGARWFGKSPFAYYGEIPQDQKPKTTGLSFMEAISTCGNKLIRRLSNIRYGFDSDSDLMMETHASGDNRSLWQRPVLDMDDLLATDWQIEAP